MTRNEYLSRLRAALLERHVSDEEEIVNEYADHFSFKLADGFSEEEIAVRLGTPETLAAQFEPGTARPASAGKVPTVIALCFADLFVFCFFVLLFAWTLVLAALAISCVAIAISLLTGTTLHGILPPIPYWCGAVFAVTLLALAVLSLAGCIYYTAFVRQLLRSYLRWHHNAIAAVSGEPVLPGLGIHPQLPAQHNRRLRTIALIALVVFIVCFILGMLVSMLSAGALEFWHVWHWFQG